MVRGGQGGPRALHGGGPDAIGTLQSLGYDIFLDLKLHDIPTTVGRAAAVVGAYGVRYLTLHAMGGAPMLRAGVEAFHRGAAEVGLAYGDRWPWP